MHVYNMHLPYLGDMPVISPQAGPEAILCSELFSVFFNFSGRNGRHANAERSRPSHGLCLLFWIGIKVR